MGQVTVIRYRQLQVVPQFLIDIDKGRGRGNAVLDGEAQSMGLPGTMIRVLSQYDNLQLIEMVVLKALKIRLPGG